MNFNWTNYNRLTRHLETMDPERFDYKVDLQTHQPGCIACQCAALRGASMSDGMLEIVQFLAVSHKEASFLYGFGDEPDHESDSWGIPFCQRADGIREALRRLAIVAARYQRPAVSEIRESQTSTASGEAAFLAECHAVARAVVGQQA